MAEVIGLTFSRRISGCDKRLATLEAWQFCRSTSPRLERANWYCQCWSVRSSTQELRQARRRERFAYIRHSASGLVAARVNCAQDARDNSEFGHPNESVLPKNACGFGAWRFVGLIDSDALCVLAGQDDVRASNGNPRTARTHRFEGAPPPIGTMQFSSSF